MLKYIVVRPPNQTGTEKHGLAGGRITCCNGKHKQKGCLRTPGDFL